MRYQDRDGKTYEGEAPAVIAEMAESAFGGPFQADDYSRQLARRAKVYSGVEVDPADRSGIVEALVSAGILQKV